MTYRRTFRAVHDGYLTVGEKVSESRVGIALENPVDGRFLCRNFGS